MYTLAHMVAAGMKKSNYLTSLSVGMERDQVATYHSNDIYAYYPDFTVVYLEVVQETLHTV